MREEDAVGFRLACYAGLQTVRTDERMLTLVRIG